MQSDGGEMSAEDVSYVRLEKADFEFASAHFCIFADEREALHGHNYRVYLELRGALDELGYVAEFGWVKRIVRELVATLDHRLLLAARCPQLTIKTENGQVRVRWRSDEWAFPEADVVQLPLANTTAELLAGYLWGEISKRLPSPDSWGRLSVEVEETPGQRAGLARSVKDSR